MLFADIIVEEVNADLTKINVEKENEAMKAIEGIKDQEIKNFFKD